jgi:hypothetical protein
MKGQRTCATNTERKRRSLSKAEGRGADLESPQNTGIPVGENRARDVVAQARKLTVLATPGDSFGGLILPLL